MSEADQRQALRHAADAVARYFVGESTMAQALDKLCWAALEAVPPAVLAGISMTVDARVGTYVFTHPEVEQVDRPQYDTGDGPCLDAFRTGQPVIIGSTRTTPEYPEFCAVAARHGLLSTLSMPMVAGAQVVGAMNFYARTEKAFDEPTVATAQGFATRAAYLLLNHQAYWDARSLSEQLSAAMASRAEIEQAKGILMALEGIGPDEAFNLLRHASQRENRKLRDVARDIVERAQHSSR